jgi:hypothetical protein
MTRKTVLTWEDPSSPSVSLISWPAERLHRSLRQDAAWFSDYLEGLRKNTRNLCQERWCPNWDSIQALPEWKPTPSCYIWERLTYELTLWSPTWEAANRSAAEKFLKILLILKVHYRCHKSPPLVSILSQINPVHITPFNFFKIYFNITLRAMSMSS